jgi:hypothetical protein
VDSASELRVSLHGQLSLLSVSDGVNESGGFVTEEVNETRLLPSEMNETDLIQSVAGNRSVALGETEEFIPPTSGFSQETRGFEGSRSLPTPTATRSPTETVSRSRSVVGAPRPGVTVTWLVTQTVSMTEVESYSMTMSMTESWTVDESGNPTRTWTAVTFQIGVGSPSRVWAEVWVRWEMTYIRMVSAAFVILASVGAMVLLVLACFSAWIARRRDSGRSSTETEFDDSSPSEELGEWKREQTIRAADQPCYGVPEPRPVDQSWREYTEVLSPRNEWEKAERAARAAAEPLALLLDEDDETSPKICEPGDKTVGIDWAEEMVPIWQIQWDSVPGPEEEGKAAEKEDDAKEKKTETRRRKKRKKKKIDPIAFYQVQFHDPPQPHVPGVITATSLDFDGRSLVGSGAPGGFSQLGRATRAKQGRGQRLAARPRGRLRQAPRSDAAGAETRRRRATPRHRKGACQAT